jgi:Ca-activated chloride channel homolog
MSNESPSNEPLRMEVHVSRRVLQALEEPQILYALAVIQPTMVENIPSAPPLSLCLVLDRSTSMAGVRLDTARRSAESIISQLRPQDRIAVVTFSDRAEVLIPIEPTIPLSEARRRLYSIQPSGGTEIYQGLSAGTEQLRQARRSGTMDHLILLTDGRTYGDEAPSLQLAEDAGLNGMEITAMGIGDEWNDTFLDALATRTGGQAVFIDQIEKLGPFLQQKFSGLGQIVADQVTVNVETAPGVTLQSAFRIHPAPMPMQEIKRMRLGSLFAGNTLSTLLEFLIPPTSPRDGFEISRLHLNAHLTRQSTRMETMLSLSLPVSTEEVPAPIQATLLSAVRNVTLARLEEKASNDAQGGRVQSATSRLDRLATRLLEIGETDLAQAVLTESATLTHTNRISDRDKKVVKYGTRDLLNVQKRKPA